MMQAYLASQNRYCNANSTSISSVNAAAWHQKLVTTLNPAEEPSSGTEVLNHRSDATKKSILVKLRSALSDTIRK